MGPKKRRLPKFRRQEWFRFVRLGERWRKPRGRDSKMRLRMKGKPALVSVGYGGPKSLRGLHPSGLAESLVRTPGEVERVDPTKRAIRIAAGVGERNRVKILARARARRIWVLNPPRICDGCGERIAKHFVGRRAGLCDKCYSGEKHEAKRPS